MAAALPQEYAFLIFEALQKVAEVIVRGRVNLAEAHFKSSGAAQSTQQPRRFRLNLEVEEVPFVRERLRSWRDNLFTPLVLDINFVERDGATGVLRHTDLVERWYVLFEPPSSPGGGASAPIEGGAGQQAQIKRAQKKLSVMLRTLYAFLRLIPTHQLVRALAHAGPTCGAGLEAGVNAGLLNSLRGDMEALLDGGVFRSHRFQDVATPLGTFRMTTAYRASSDFVIPEAPAQRMIEPGQIIADYVGVAPASAPHPSTEQFQHGGGSEGKGGGDYREGGPSGLSQALRQHEEDSAHDMLLLLSPARHLPAAVPHSSREERPYPPADPPQSPPYLISYPRSLTSPSSRQLHLQQHHSYSHPHHYHSHLLGPQPTDPKLSRCPSMPIPVPYPSLPHQVPRHVGGSAPSSGLSSPFLTPPPAPSIPHFSHGAMPTLHTHTLSRFGSHPMDIPGPHPPRHRSSLSSPSALPFPLSSSPVTQPLASPPLPPPSGTRYASTSAVGAQKQQQQQQQQQQHHLGTRARSLDSAGFGAMSPLFGLRRKTSEDRHPSSAETSPARHDPASSDSTLTKALGGLTLGPTSPFQQQHQQQRQPPRSPMTPTTAKGRYGSTLPSTGSTPPFSVGVWHQHKEQVGPSAPPPLPIGYSKLGCSPPFSVQTTTLLSRSPQQPPPPSPPTLAKAARSTSLDSSASRSYTTYGSRDGGLGPQAGGVGVTSGDQASTLQSNRQYHQTFSSSTGGSGSSLLGGGGSAGSSGSGGNSGGSLPAAPSLDTLGESPFKNSGTALLGSSMAVTGSLTCTPTRSSRSCVAGGDPRSAPGLAGSAYALRSLECLQAEEAVSRSLGASSDEDLPFAVPSRGGRSTYMGGSSSSTSSGSSITGSRTSSQLLVGGGGSSSLRPPLPPTHTPACAVVGSGGAVDGGGGGGGSMSSSKVAAARLAEQCARAPPLQIFSPPSTYSSLSFTAAGGGDGGRGQQMMQVGDATGGATGGGSTLEGSPRTPRHTGSSMVGTLSSSRASGPSVESLKEDLRAFREFSSGLGRVKTLPGDHK